MLTENTVMPDIVIGSSDHERLMEMASGLSSNLQDIADQLIGELVRSDVVEQSSLPDDVVRIGSTVSFTTTDGFDRTFKLVYPSDADITAGKVSILTPVGAVLIGLREGQTIPWTARDGRQLALTVLSVQQDR